MTGIENQEYSIGSYIVGAFGYETMKRKALFRKQSETHYKMSGKRKIVHYRSIQTTAKAIENEGVQSKSNRR